MMVMDRWSELASTYFMVFASNMSFYLVDHLGRSPWYSRQISQSDPINSLATHVSYLEGDDGLIIFLFQWPLLA